MKSSDSRTNSKYKSPYGCRTNSHCVYLICTQIIDSFFMHCSINFIIALIEVKAQF